MQQQGGKTMLDFSQPFLEKGEKLVCFGDSLTFATNSYVSHLQEALPEIEVIKSGRGGDKTTWALTRLESAVLAHKPDAVLIMLGVNDALVGHGIWADEPSLSPETYYENLIWIVHLCRLQGIKKFSIATAFGIEGERYIDYGNRLAPFYLAARNAADRTGARLVPLDCLFTELRNGAPLAQQAVTTDGIHPTEEVQKKIAECMLDAWKMR